MSRTANCIYMWATEKRTIHLRVTNAVRLVLATSGFFAGVLAAPECNYLSTTAAAPPRGAHLSVVIHRSGQDSRPLLAPGQRFTAIVSVDNLTGQVDAHTVTLTAKLPRGVKLNRTAVAPNRTESQPDGIEMVWNLGTVKAHAFPRLFALDLTVEPTVGAPAEFTIAAHVSSDDHDANTKHDTTGYEIFVRPSASDLAVDSDLQGVAFTVGAPITFTAETDNNGTAIATKSALKLRIPAGIRFVSSNPAPAVSERTLSWQLGDISPGASIVRRVTVSLDPALALSIGDTKNATLPVFVFDVATASVDSDLENNHLEIKKSVERAGFDARVWLTDDSPEPGELPSGEDVVYTLSYGNFGNQSAPKSSVSLSLPDGLTLVSADPVPARSSKTDKFPGGVAGWDGGDLRIGESRLIKCRVHVAYIPEDGSVVIAKVSADGVDIDTRNNVAYSWRRAPRGMATHITAGKGPALLSKRGHSFRWISFIVLLAVVAAAWVWLHAKGKTRTQ